MADLVKQYGGLYPLYNDNNNYYIKPEDIYIYISSIPDSNNITIKRLDKITGEVKKNVSTLPNNGLQANRTFCVDINDNIYIATSDGSNAGRKIVKMNNSGSILLSIVLPVQIHTLVVDKKENIYVSFTRTFIPSINPNNAINFVKYNKNGTVLLSYEWQGGAAPQIRDISVDDEYNYILVGIRGNTPTAQIRKFSENGTQLWSKLIPTNPTAFNGVSVDKNGNIYGSSDVNAGTFKFDKDGNTLVFDTTVNDRLENAIDNENSVYIGGTRVTKRDINGNLIFTISISTSKISVDRDNNFYFINGVNLRKYNKSGTLLWTYVNGTTINDVCVYFPQENPI